MDFLSSRENKNIKEYVKLLTQKKYRDLTDKFVIEGIKLVLEAQKSTLHFEMVFVTQECLEKHSDELEKLFQTTQVFIIDETLENKLSLSQSLQGIYAVLKKPQQTLDESDIIGGGKYVCLCDLQDNGNVGTIIRAAEAIGIDGVVISDQNCDIFSIKTVRATMGSVFRLPILISTDVANLIKTVGASGVQTIATVVNPNANDILQTKFSKNVLVLIGNEGNGLPQDLISLCKEKVTIKMQGKAESLNASMAAALVMWELSK
ncbi:MAG: RNA methyltransferase [Oscillospiraceae bacterium]